MNFIPGVTFCETKRAGVWVWGTAPMLPGLEVPRGCLWVFYWIKDKEM